MLASFEVIVFCLGILAVIDVLVARHTAHRWFCIHAVANAFVVATALPGLAATLSDPLHAMDGRVFPNVVSLWAAGSMFPISMVNAVHLYHVLAFKLNPDELFHHALFLPLVGGPGQWYEWGALRSTLAFGISGLPGGIDYFMLVGVKGGRVSRLLQKQVSAALNQWLRTPLIVLEVGVHYLAWRYDTTVVPLPVNVLVGGLAFFNALYYLGSSLRSYERAQLEARAKRPAARTTTPPPAMPEPKAPYPVEVDAKSAPKQVKSEKSPAVVTHKSL